MLKNPCKIRVKTMSHNVYCATFKIPYKIRVLKQKAKRHKSQKGN